MSGWTHEYQIADPEWDLVKFPTTFGRDPNTPSKLMTWMVNHFGRIDYRKSAGKWRYSIQEISIHGKKHLRIRFRSANDAMLFKLVWL